MQTRCRIACVPISVVVSICALLVVSICALLAVYTGDPVTNMQNDGVDSKEVIGTLDIGSSCGVASEKKGMPDVNYGGPTSWWEKRCAAIRAAENVVGSKDRKEPLEISFAHLLDALIPAGARNHFAVNIGGNDGKTHDPVYPLFAELHYGGVVVEPGKQFQKALHHNLGKVNYSKRIFIAAEGISPANARAILGRFNTPYDLDVLKVDIDSFDLDALTSILNAGYRPKIVMLEVNPDIPPPFRWHVGYAASFPFGNGGMKGFYGVSPDALFTYMRPNYTLVAFEMDGAEHNAWFARKDLLSLDRSWHGMVREFWSQRVRYKPYGIIPKFSETGYCIHFNKKKASCPLLVMLQLARKLAKNDTLSPIDASIFFARAQGQTRDAVVRYGSEMNVQLRRHCPGRDDACKSVMEISGLAGLE